MTPTLANIERQRSASSPALPSIIGMHLLPGLVITVVFALVASIGAQLGWPSALALLLTWLLAGIPLELGLLLYQGQKRNGRLSLDGIVLFREPLRHREYVWPVAVLLLWTALISTLFMPLADGLRRSLFGWWPTWLITSDLAANLGRYPPGMLWAVVLLSLALNIAVPIVEELYFRGYLLPRLSPLQGWAPPISVALFSLYHFWLPWENPTRIVALLPVVYVVWRKRNVFISIAVHCLLNSIGSIGLLVLVLNGTQAQ